MPQVPQVGALRLQKRGLTVAGGWVPNWLYDFYCVENSAVEAGRELGLEFRPVLTPKGEDLGASQIVIESTAHEWFDVGDLERLLVPLHGVGSETCDACGVLRWMPVEHDLLPAPHIQAFEGQPPVVASPEWFGAGLMCIRNILWRRDVADYLLSVGPRDFVVGAEFEV